MWDLKTAWIQGLKIAPIIALLGIAVCAFLAGDERTEKPVLHGKHWVAITGKPLAASAGAMTFLKGGNAVDAACAMLAAVCTMHDTLGWGGETQALIFHPVLKKVIGVNALGVAPAEATVRFFREKGMKYPPPDGPLSAVTPGTPGGLMVMLAEFGTLSLAQVLEPALQMAEGYPMEAQLAAKIEKEKDKLKEWPYSKKILLPHLGSEWEAPEPGEVFRQPDLAVTLKKLVDAEASALAKGKSRREAIMAAYDRFYKGDIAAELVRSTREQGGLLRLEDLSSWTVRLEEPVMTTYKDISVYKLTCWTQGPVMLQALNMLENLDLKGMGYNSTEYIHAVYQVMNLAYADRDFYYGDPYFPPEEPLLGLLSKDYARERLKTINWSANEPVSMPGDPFPFEGKKNPYLRLLEKWPSTAAVCSEDKEGNISGTTSIQAADSRGWVVSVTPSGGWIPACIAGSTGMGLSQRLQSFVLDEAENPFNVLAPGKRPRVTLTPGMALKEGKPFLSFAVQGGDTQDQNLLQFFLNIVEFGMNVQQACEAPNFNSYQMRSSFEDHESCPGKIDVNAKVSADVREKLASIGYKVVVKKYTSGPINAVFFDWKHGTLWGGSSNYGEDYGIAW